MKNIILVNGDLEDYGTEATQEDAQAINELAQKYLEDKGYTVEWYEVGQKYNAQIHNGEELEALASDAWEYAFNNA